MQSPSNVECEQTQAIIRSMQRLMIHLRRSPFVHGHEWSLVNLTLQNWMKRASSQSAPDNPPRDDLPG